MQAKLGVFLDPRPRNTVKGICISMRLYMASFYMPYQHLSHMICKREKRIPTTPDRVDSTRVTACVSIFYKEPSGVELRTYTMVGATLRNLPRWSSLGQGSRFLLLVIVGAQCGLKWHVPDAALPSLAESSRRQVPSSASPPLSWEH